MTAPAHDRWCRLPGTASLPLVGDAPGFLRDPRSFLVALQQRHGDVARFRLGTRRAVFLAHPDDVEQVLLTTGTDVRKGFTETDQFSTGEEGGQEGMATSEGALWRRQRKLAQPAMHPRRIAGYAEVMTRYAAEAVAAWRPGEQRDLHRDVTALTQRITVRTLFGTELGDRSRAISAALDASGRATDAQDRSLVELVLPRRVPTPARSRAAAADAEVRRLVTDLLRERFAEGPEQRDAHDDLLAMLLAATDEQGRDMSQGQLYNELLTLYSAGHETTANTLGFAFGLLARRPDLRDQLAAEVDRVVGDRPPAFADVPGLALAGAVVKETLRLFPIASVLPRIANVDLWVSGGHVVPGGTQLWISQWVTHRDPRWWPAPDEFRPGRWLDGSTDDLPRFAWFPFGGGPRVCYGNRFALAEAVIILATVLRRFDFASTSSAPVRPAPGTMLLGPDAGTPVVLSARALSTGSAVAASGQGGAVVAVLPDRRP